ncbi:unnamed protein product [Merluccius merluccius]
MRVWVFLPVAVRSASSTTRSRWPGSRWPGSRGVVWVRGPEEQLASGPPGGSPRRTTSNHVKVSQLRGRHSAVFREAVAGGEGLEDGSGRVWTGLEDGSGPAAALWFRLDAQLTGASLCSVISRQAVTREVMGLNNVSEIAHNYRR